MPFTCVPPCQRTFETIAAWKQHKATSLNHSGDLVSFVKANQGLDDDRSINGQSAYSTRSSSLASGVANALTTIATSYSEAPAPGSNKEVRCVICNIGFADQDKLQNHNEYTHNQTNKACGLCKKTFGSAAALALHLRNSPAHAKVKTCEPCNKTFSSESALEQHLNDSPAHKKVISCEPCNKTFSSEAALEAHLKDSPVHKKVISCGPCNKTFSSESALEQHLNDSPFHKKGISCEPCNKTFGSESALEAHLKASPAHKTVIACTPCNKTFGSESAREQHYKNSPVHKNKVISCEPCNKTFVSELAREAHLRDALVHKQVLSLRPSTTAASTRSEAELDDGQADNSLVHLTTLSCSLCNRSFGSAAALAAHVKDSPNHNHNHNNNNNNNKTITVRDTPLDGFFGSYLEFAYDPDNSPEKNFRQLHDFYGWKKDSDDSKEAWKGYQAALVEEIQMWYGDADDISSWYHLFRALNVQDRPSEVEDCIKIVSNIHVNIVDLVNWGRAGSPKDKPVTIFKTVEKLSVYTYESGKFFPREELISKKGQTNIVLRYLLRMIIKTYREKKRREACRW